MGEKPNNTDKILVKHYKEYVHLYVLTWKDPMNIVK